MRPSASGGKLQADEQWLVRCCRWRGHRACSTRATGFGAVTNAGSFSVGDTLSLTLNGTISNTGVRSRSGPAPAVSDHQTIMWGSRRGGDHALRQRQHPVVAGGTVPAAISFPGPSTASATALHNAREHHCRRGFLSAETASTTTAVSIWIALDNQVGGTIKAAGRDADHRYRWAGQE